MREPKEAPEITVRGTLLGAAITAVFLAANVYLGLKTGMTFSSSIPAAIISMSVLAMIGGGGILENNIVQTQASAAGTLCNVILALPGLLLVGFWHGFPLLQTIALCLFGGLLGVAYSIPLRRVMVVESDLPFPEGVAAAEVLRAGHEEGGQNHGLRELGVSAAAAAFLNFLATGVKVIPDQLTGFVAIGHSVFRLGGSLSLALIGVGYLVRIGACLALMIGVLIAWGVAVPILTATSALPPHGDLGAFAEIIWSEKVRLIGAGIIAVGGLWTVATLVRPMATSIGRALQASRSGRGGGSDKDRQYRDVPITWVGAAILGLCGPTALLLLSFTSATKLAGSTVLLVSAVTLVIAVLGFLMATACGYMAGLLGSSSSPISGIGILTTMLVAVGFGLAFPAATGGEAGRFVVAITLFVTSMIVTVSSIANDNLQDLKTGHMIGATPWRQQAALAIGVVVGAITIGPVLQLLYHAYGFVGSQPRSGMDPHDAMAAPQAALMAQIANGIVQQKLPWAMVGIGGALGAAFVALEAFLKRKNFSLPALTVGIGIYLPPTVVVTIAVGGVIGWIAERVLVRRAKRQGTGEKLEEQAAELRRRGVLMSSGFLVGESMMGVVLAGTDAVAGKSSSLSLAGFGNPYLLGGLGLAAFLGAVAVFFRATSRPVET